MIFDAGPCSVAVIGAGHAGIEAALACARLGLDTVIFSLNLDSVGNMPCNPAIGGTGKGQLVRELDALGGEMARAADKACIQYRMLNLGKGAAVHSPRAQADRRHYQSVMKNTLENQKNLRVKQAEITEIGLERGAVAFVRTSTGATYPCRAAIICSGTYLGGRVVMGGFLRDSGPDGLAGAYSLGGCLRKLGLSLRRFKTGTPPRVNGASVDYSKMEIQLGDECAEPFSFETPEAPPNRAVCYLTYTNERTHEIIRNNLHRSPLFGGVIEGVGPRYCPSIEDKVVRFAEKKRHQLFIEPMGLGTNELYIQGFSSSLPEDVQIESLRTVPGLENAEITRAAYAIEYDCVDPTQLRATLEVKGVPGLFGAGQFCGSSGYEEAAVQGFVAGVNAARKILGQSPFILRRDSGYIGALIDDLVTKGTEEPYRMMTSRSEYRLLHRQDNADERLSHLGLEIGLVSPERHRAVLEKYESIRFEIDRLEKTFVPPTAQLNSFLADHDTAPVETGVSLASLLRRPQLDYAAIAPFDPERDESLPRAVTQGAQISLKYAGYIERQLRQVKEFEKLESRRLPENIDYEKINGLRLEARAKLQKIRPENFGQASRISGVSPADVAALMVYVESRSDSTN
ncbi:MAG: tRNA uridine-5-carboxymethylaminomethyl(34) synthesis enzyme MnmG [Oscillospiraceae bacterium]|jgi:tRNA uridine 5-carboxymethylaminomethyl modification enzyme|nr:tRNA uridine-5-carboxymethylaminomethyl(34) synthesis enzyme MnmG [Oscillospiraceae bacterium]